MTRLVARVAAALSVLVASLSCETKSELCQSAECRDALSEGDAPVCECNADIDDDGEVNLTSDCTVVNDCVSDPDNCAERARADINCDGTVDLCDAEICTCVFSQAADCCEDCGR